MSTYWTEVIRRVGMEGDGNDFIEVGPDADGLDCVEIRRRCDGKIVDRLTVQPKGARMLAAAIVACANELEKAEVK